MNIVKNFFVRNKFEILYLLTLISLIILINRPEQPILVGRFFLVVFLWILPFRVNLKFKIFNTFILASMINYIASLLFADTNYRVNGLVVILTVMLFISLIVNIFAVISNMYHAPEDDNRRRQGLKLGYILVAFIILVGTVVSTYSLIYNNIAINNIEAFNYSEGIEFDSLYYSFVTYFTVGYGEITPISKLARSISMSQMALSYILTCLIIPSILVAIQKLIDERYIKKKKQP